MVRLKDNSHLVFLFFILSASLTINVVLGLKVKALSRHVLPRAGVQDGITLPSIPAFEVSGAKRSIDFNDPRTTVLYIFSPNCPWCRRNRLNISTLASAKSKDFRFIGLSTTPDHLVEYLASAPLPFPSFRMETSNTSLQALGFFQLTPQTIVVSPGGHVMKVWTGAYQDERQKEVEDYFRVKLPGLTDASTAKDQSGAQKR